MKGLSRSPSHSQWERKQGSVAPGMGPRVHVP